jgi:hypothetical protein
MDLYRKSFPNSEGREVFKDGGQEESMKIHDWFEKWQEFQWG